MKKRMLSLLLALTMLLGMLPLSAQAAEDLGTALPGMVDVDTNIAWTATKPDGSTITQNTYKGKTQILIFFSVTGECYNTNNTLAGLMESDLLNNDNIQIIAIGCSGKKGDGEIVTASKDTLQAYMDEFGLSAKKNVIFAWNADNSAVLNYLKAAGVIEQTARSFTYAVSVVLDSTGHLRTAWMGDYAADYYTSVLSLLSETGVEGDVEGYKTYRTTVTGTDDYGAAYQELDILNAYRTQNGLSSLKMDAGLLENAMQRAAEIAVYYSHTRPDNSSCFSVIADTNTGEHRENIAIGYRSVDAVMTGWEHSDGHNKNMLAAGNQSVGIGCFTGSNGVKCWVQLFSSKAGAEEQNKTSGAKTKTHDIVAAWNMLDLSVSPTSASIRAGETVSFTLSNRNKEFASSAVEIGFTAAGEEDAEVAKAEVKNDGSAVVTAVGGGQTNVKLGLASSGSGEARTLSVPVKVQATDLTKAMFTVDTTAETYDGTAKTKSIVSSLTENTNYTVSYQNNTNAGTAKITVAGKGLYSGTLEYTFTINPAKRTLAANAAKTQLHVGEQAVKITVTDNASGNSPRYTYTTSNSAVVTVDANGNVTPAGVGTATVTVAAAATANYERGSADVSFTVTALPKQKLTFATAGPINKTYGDEKFTNAAVNATQGGGAVTYESSNKKVATVDANSGLVTVVGAGDAEITATAAGVGNEYAETAVSYTLKVAPKTLTIQSVTIKEKTYDGKTDAEVDAVTIDGLVNGDTLTAGVDYTVKAAFETAAAGESKTVTGTVTLLTKNENYTLKSETFTTTGKIKKAQLARSKNLLTKAEAGYKRTVDLSTAVALPSRESFAFTVISDSYTGLTGAAFGTGAEAAVLTLTSGSGADPTVTGDVIAIKAESGNYEGTVTFRVIYTDKLPVSISGVIVEDKTYDGKPAAYTIGKDVAICDIADGKDVTEIVREACGGTENIVHITWHNAGDLNNALTAAPVTAGDYVLVGTVETNEHYGIVELPFTICKATITVTADDKAAYVGDAEPTYTYTVSGLAEGEELAAQPTVTSPTANMKKSGSYPITVSGAAAPAGGNYEDIVYVDGTLKVSSRSSGDLISSSTYPVSVSGVVSNGSISISSKNAKKGSTVTITVKPDEGYRLDKLTITDRKGNPITVTESGDGKYTFIMPGLRVNISADFAKIEEEPSKPVEIDKIFSDISAGAWYSEAVAYVYEKGIMVGTGENVFSPDAVTTRGTIVTMLYRLENEPAVTSVLFQDVSADEWYAGGVAWATANGIVNGYGNGSFGPKDVITREQMVAILYRYAKLKGYDVSAGADLSGFTDKDQISPYAADAFAWANAVGLINGTSTITLSPEGTATRAQIATMLMRFCEKLEK